MGEHITQIEEGLDHKGGEIRDDIHLEVKMESLMVYKNQVCLSGTCEEGIYRSIWYDSNEFLRWIDKDTIKDIKQKLIKNIKQL
tara:strand:+ start:307 stop:558 length:252 start_codon:yes stop_codon:yes gene_type:complete